MQLCPIVDRKRGIKVKRLQRIVLTLLLAISAPAFAFDTVDEQIDHYLDVLKNGSFESKVQMLKRLQWSGLTDPRMYNPIKSRLEHAAMSSRSLNKSERSLLSHMIRALGYSGDERNSYILISIKDFSADKKLRNHAGKALVQLEKFKRWNQLIADNDFDISGKSVEVTTYMKMLSTDDFMIQRLAARAIFHERQKDMDLLALTAEKLEGLYLRQGLDREAQDTVAWLCKAVGEYASWQYDDLLSNVARNSPYKAVRKHAAKYAP